VTVAGSTRSGLGNVNGSTSPIWPMITCSPGYGPNTALTIIRCRCIAGFDVSCPSADGLQFGDFLGIVLA
jgi:hypothetical protein